MLTTVLPDDLKQLNDKLVEGSTSKLALQMKVDELEAVQVNIKVSHIIFLINHIISSIKIVFIYFKSVLYLFCVYSTKRNEWNKRRSSCMAKHLG